MASDKIVYYDDEFIGKFDRLRELIEEEDRPALYRYLLDHFGRIFKLFQYYANHIATGGARDFEQADEETMRELMRPLSYRQYRLIEGSFSRWKKEEALVIRSIWDFLYDDGRIYEKKAMSSAEVSGCSMILENVYCCLAQTRHEVFAPKAVDDPKP